MGAERDSGRRRIKINNHDLIIIEPLNHNSIKYESQTDAESLLLKKTIQSLVLYKKLGNTMGVLLDEKYDGK